MYALARDLEFEAAAQMPSREVLIVPMPVEQPVISTGLGSMGELSHFWLFAGMGA